jgi:uncharacterized protein (TIGR00297 family)
MTINPLQVMVGSILALIISLVAWRAHMLSEGGAAAATLLGTLVYGFGGLGWAVLLVAFFLSSSLLSRFSRDSKSSLNDKFSKGSRRDAGQVLANGFIPGVFSCLNLFYPSHPILWLGFAGSLAAVNADTWATELGVLGSQAPRLITSWKPVEKGESGGVTGLGTLAALGGASFIAATAAGFGNLYFADNGIFNPALALICISLAGFCGSIIDSILGAALQASYFCPVCNKRTERFPRHNCGNPTTLVRGQPWLNNDGVNVLCAFAGSCLSALSWILLM